MITAMIWLVWAAYLFEPKTLDPNQILSGILARALACGAAVCATIAVNT